MFFAFNPAKAMKEKTNQDGEDQGFLLSLNLMILGGILLLFVIITANKLINHYFTFVDPKRDKLEFYVNILEQDTFKIYSTSELNTIWFAGMVSTAGLLIVVVKLVKTWKA